MPETTITEKNKVATIATSEVIFRKDLYPRLKPIPSRIQEYAENIENLPPIEIDQHNILIDGYHRWKAYETVELETIPCIRTEVKSEKELAWLGIKRNAKHGQQLSWEDKKSQALKYWCDMLDEAIISNLSISKKTFLNWTKAKRQAKEDEQKKAVYDLWMRCETQETIAEQVGIPQSTVSLWIGIFRNFVPQLYIIWNFGKATNDVRHFGNIPPEIIENLLYYYTKPFDVVFDPFGGGGSTIDVCLKRKRRYYVSDLNPIPARADIRKHDITTGLPDSLPVPDFVFLDPPYWKQAEGKYSNDPTDLANMELETFLTNIGNIARDVKRKWRNGRSGKLAIIIGAWKKEGKIIDLPILCHERISKYLQLEQRIIVPYSTQVHGGAFVKMAIEKKELLYLSRDLMVFSP